MQNDFYRLFSKSFKNFVKGLPIIVEYLTNPNGVIIKDTFTQDELNYYFDFNNSVSENIYKIKILIQDWFPILVEKKISYKKMNGIELMDAYSCKDYIPLDDCLEMCDYTNYRIYKVIMGHKPNQEPRDEVFLENLSNNKKYRYSLNFPVSIFLKYYREKWDNEEAWDEFKNKSTLLNEIYSIEN